jgi:hypothetical protein
VIAKENILFLERVDAGVEVLIITYDNTDKMMKEDAYATSIRDVEIQADNPITGYDLPMTLMPKWIQNHIHNEGVTTYGVDTQVLVRAFETSPSGLVPIEFTVS